MLPLLGGRRGARRKLYDLERDPEETAPIRAAEDTPESAAARARLESRMRG